MASRSGFSSRIGFIAAAAGSAVGLGNIWRFPYETGSNGGGAFLFIYLICTLIIGFPLIVGEIAVGRRAQANPYGSYNLLGGKRWALVGLFGVLCGIMILSFYNVVAGWAFGHFMSTAFGDLLNSPSFEGHFDEYAGTIGSNFFVSLIFMAITAFIVMQGVQKGIEAASKLLMPFLFIILVGLIIYGLTLDGAMKGVEYYLVPDFSKINLGTVFSAMGQAFFSLSLGMGALITYGSYFSKKDNIVTSAAIVTVVDVSVAFLAGLLILPLVFSQPGLEPGAGPGLVFEALPGVFQSMGPLLGRVIGGLFFLLLCVAALTSTVSLLEVPVAYLVDEKKWKRGPVVIGLASLVFIIGLPSMFSFGGASFCTEFLQYFDLKDGVLKFVDRSFFDFVDDIFSKIGLPLGGFLLSIFIATKWKTSNLSDEITSGFENYKGSITEKFINLMITIICPLVLFLIVLSTILLKFFGVALI